MRSVLNYTLMVFITLSALELAAYLTGLLLVKHQLMIESFHSEGYKEYLQERNPVTGWPAASAYGSDEYDISGARISSNFPDPNQKSCIALFGDSFTWGDEVGPDDAYGNVLAGLLNCRVANYGVGGFGTDQAYLRYLSQVDDPAPVVILGHYSENVIRNVNQLRDLMAGTRFGFKPRFTISTEGDLEVVPLPTLTESEYRRLPFEADKLLPHEYFLPNTGQGLIIRKFPNLLSVPKVLSHYRLAARIAGKPSYADFYDWQHPSRALAVTVGILESFHEVAQSRGQRPIVLLIPDAKDLEFGLVFGRFPFEPLSDMLSAKGVVTIPLASRLLEWLDGRRPCELYTSCNPSGGHFNAHGYRLVAQIVNDWLQEQDLRTHYQ